MSKDHQYFKIPLSILRQGKSEDDALELALRCGTVNAGVGYRHVHGLAKFDALLVEADEDALSQGMPLDPPDDLRPPDIWVFENTSTEDLQEAWYAAHAGSRLCRFKGGDRVEDALAWCQYQRQNEVFFSLRSDWMFNALHTARGSEDEDCRPLSWREFRVLAAILSAQLNDQSFAFLSWESIQARACGYHSKKLFQENEHRLPTHCKPLSRHQIRDTCDRLEALGFFARCRYSTGKRGGYMAYSFRHRREDLPAAIRDWSVACRSLELKTTAFRETDLKTIQKLKASPAWNQPTPKAASAAAVA